MEYLNNYSPAENSAHALIELVNHLAETNKILDDINRGLACLIKP